MADLTEVSVDLLWVVSIEEAGHLRVLGIAWPGKQRHGNPSLFQPLLLPEKKLGSKCFQHSNHRKGNLLNKLLSLPESWMKDLSFVSANAIVRHKAHPKISFQPSLYYY